MSVINTNVKALVAQESMRSNNLKLSTAMERLSTGLRINSAKDDAAGLAISNRMTSQIRGLSMAVKNANDGISMAQTADGAYGQVTNMLQRMRELAVQAATGTMSSSDRESLQLEVQELQAEVDNVAKSTKFNGIALLDGSSRSVTLQTGANEGDTISVGFSSVKTKDIGSGDRPALTSFGGRADDLGKLSSGVLMLNGVLVGGSLSTDDTVSFGSSGLVAASAVAKAAAINRVTDQSGVFAKVDETRVLGATMDPASAGNSGTITINGVATATVTTTSDTEVTRQLLAQAINNISAQTGVVAINTGDDNQGIQLVAADGRNITVEFGDDLAAGNTGIAQAGSGTYVGTFSLYSANGSAINVNHAENKTSQNLEDVGLRVGSFEADMAQKVTKARTEVSAAGTAPVFAGDTLVINGIAISKSNATDDNASWIPGSLGHATASNMKAASAIAIAAAINKKTDEHGVTAKADANVLRGTSGNFSAAAGGSMFLNGVSITISAGTRNAVIDAINEKQGQTGVVASAFGDGIELRAADGRNISIASDVDATGLGLSGVTIGDGAGSAAATTHFASVVLSSTKAFTVERGNEGGDNFEDFGFRAGTFGGTDTGTKIADINISTQSGASQAITAIDAAIADVAAAQAKSGAFQNRLDAIVSVLAESSENLNASRSRILDTDYATETTALAKAQIVQQAATAMLAQANQQQQSVLALLQ
jgi:flagellin